MEQSWSALVIDDDAGIRQSVRLCLETEAARVVGVGTVDGARDALERGRYDVVFLDLWLGKDSGLILLPEILRRQPGVGVIVVTAYATIETAVDAMRLGATDYLPKPFTPEQVRLAARRVVGDIVLRRQIAELQELVADSEGELSFETSSTRYVSFLQTAARASASEASILLRGESGTGKTVLARWIRQHSTRAEAPFVTVHCPLLSSDLMSSVLFGHKRGAFTGAVADAVGKVEQAEGGTLFLDEVAELTADAQARLLRFLNDRSYERVGDAQERRANVRLLAATNRALEDDVQSGRFREDLFYRLNVIALTVPPLRKRIEDVLPLARHYLAHFGRRQGRQGLQFSESCAQQITAYSWPGNLREMRNAVERAAILSPTSVIEFSDLGLAETRDVTATGMSLGDDVDLESIEREHLARVVARSASFEAAARTLGIDITTLQRKRKRYGLS